MATWKIEEPQTLEFERVTRLRVRTIRGRLSVVGNDERRGLEGTEVRGGPLTVRHDDHGLEIGYDDGARPGLMPWVIGWRRQAVVIASVRPPSEAGRTPPMAGPVPDQRARMLA
jgi:hypothetical protein